MINNRFLSLTCQQRVIEMGKSVQTVENGINFMLQDLSKNIPTKTA